MEFRKLGQDKVPVSSLGLGCMGMSEFYGASDDAQSMSTLGRALEMGINFLDTADTYGFGHNEILLGKLIESGGSGTRRQLVIATKFGIVREQQKYERRIDNSPAYIRDACNASLKRLRVETIDLYYCHRRNPSVPIEDMVGAMADLVRQGKIRQIGLSEVSVDSLRKAWTVHPIAAVQSEYSLWSREPETQMLGVCKALGTSFIAYSPLGRAFLTGKLNATVLEKNDFRNIIPRYAGDAAIANQKLVEDLTRFAGLRGATNAQIALAWLLCKHEHVVPIPGTRRIPYLEENVAAMEIELSEADVEELDLMFDPKKVAGDRYPEAGMVGIE